ncbi:MAG: UvrD-helicase domain-containing protein [Prevotella sp.]|nr:UvrD-helicase domain-containing protein [Prevotella sp.]
MVKALTVYKASAGSGKTFTLTVEYIKLLVKNPTSYRNILAVTFTNKATEEMKMRILSQLFGIWKQLPDSNAYTQRILEETGLPVHIVCQRAGEALHLLLHNYNYFRVETIDSFFQSVLRNLARELDLTANLRISLNDTQVEEQAVDQLIDSLTHTDIMLQWLLSYIMEKISDDRSWNIIGQVKQFGRTIFRDYYKSHHHALNETISQKGFIEAYSKQLREIRSTAMARMQELADKFFNTLQSEGLDVEDLSYNKSGVASIFLKIKQGQLDENIVGKRVCECCEDATKWCKKSHVRAKFIHALAESTLIPLVVHTIEERPRQWLLYQSAELTLRHLSQLRLLGSIEQKVRQLNDEANRFLLSDTQQLLQALISDSDSPFIFEKLGTQLEHVMIDEFQDTSTIQWQNFKVLLEECMSHRNAENLIVGDVKQSIYRWRSGDWRLLNAIDLQFTYANERIEIKPLDTNYRSERNIIAFNNVFFTEAARQEYDYQYEKYPIGAEQLKHAYADVAQQWQTDAKPIGHVNIRLLTKDCYQEETLRLLGDTVKQLVLQGAALTDIAILVRTNKNIPVIAEHFALNLPDIPIVSDEAYRLDASVAVTLLIQALHLLIHPDDELAKATLATLYQRSVIGNETINDNSSIDYSALLPEAFIRHTIELLQLPLYELIEKLHSIFQLSRLSDQSAYLCAFYDQLNKFIQDNSTDIDAFVCEWEETICSKTVQGDSLYGVRILSIHKSKGLEFRHVIIPYCDWKLELPDILWCKPSVAPFNALPIVPIDYSEKKLRGTIYEHDYLDEHLQNTVDNLNLLYVGFTRAISSLHVIGQRGSKSSRSTLIETILPDVAKQLEDSMLIGMDNEEEPIEFSYGTLSISKVPNTSKAAKTQNVFLQPATPQFIQLETFNAKTEFRQSNSSRRFIEGDDEEQEMSYIKMGSVLHEIFSTIRTTDDIGYALQRLQQEGVLYDNERTRDKLTKMLRTRLENRQVSKWFSDKWQLFNECTILSMQPDGSVKERRPDRVITDGKETHVIDFKFGKPKPEYLQQVRKYMQLLQQMGLTNVKGWLWYVYSNKIEEVTA